MSRPMNYTTRIAVRQTVGECSDLLARAGASSVATHYEDGKPAGLSFSLRTPHGQRNFTLPVDVPAMHAVLQRDLRADMPHVSSAEQGRLLSREHAERVAWRVVKDWLEANLALIAAQMATLDSVMLPFIHVGPDRTLYQAYREHEAALALEPGDG